MNDSMPEGPYEPGEVAIERLTIEHSVYYGVQVPNAGGDAPPPLLIALHGFGQSCRSFMRSFTPFQMENILVVTPQAPNQFFTPETHGRASFLWITTFDPENALADLTGYLKRLMEVIDEKCTYDPEKVFFLGFSQGLGIALHFCTTGIVKPAGFVACSGALHPDMADKLATVEKFPVFLLHGEHDQEMPIERGRETEQIMRDAGFEVDTLYHDGIHELTPDQTGPILEWIQARI